MRTGDVPRPHADDENRYWPTFFGIGQAHAIANADDELPAGRLVVPDPEQRHGWREHYVPAAPATAKAGTRSIGFRRP
jgi:hypothetical protein